MEEPGTQTCRPVLRLLGQWQVSGVPQGARVVMAARRLLALVALRGPMTRAEIRGTLWPLASEEAASARLRNTLWRLSAMRSSLLEERSGAITLAAAVTVDVEELFRAASAVGAGLADIPPSRFDADLLPGWDEDWLVVDRERIRQARLHALEHLSESLLAQGDFSSALDAALTAVQADPLRESAHRAVIRVHLAEGNLVEALLQYERCRATLDTEVGVRPTRQLEALIAGAERAERRSVAALSSQA